MLKDLVKKNKVIFSILVLFFVVMFFSIKGTVMPLSNSSEIRDFRIRENTFTGTPLEFSRARTQYIQMVALYNRGSLELIESEALLVRPDAGYLNGKFYSLAIPGISILLYPFFFLGTLVGLEQLLSIIPIFLLHGVNIFLFFTLLQKLFKDKALSGAGVLIFGFGTLLLPYTSSFLYHNFTIFFILALFLLTKKISESPKKSSRLFLFSSILIGISVFIDYPTPIILLPFYIYQIYLIRRQDVVLDQNKALKAFLYSILIASVCISGLLTMQSKMFGNPLQMTNTQLQYIEKETTAKLSEETILRETAKKNRLERFIETKYIKKNSLRVFIGKDKGLLVLSPILLLSFFGIFFARRQKILKPILIPLFISSLFSYLLYTAFIGGGGDHSLGQRYMIPLIPLILIFIVSTLKRIREIRFFRIPLVILFFWTFFSHFSGLFTTISSTKGAVAHKYGIMQYDYLMRGTTSSFWIDHVYSGIPLFVYPIFFAAITTILTTYFLYKKTDISNDKIS